MGQGMTVPLTNIPPQGMKMDEDMPKGSMYGIYLPTFG